MVDNTDQVEAFLAHHGVKGMRWGVRRTDAALGNPDGGKNGVDSKSGVDVTKSKMAEGSAIKLTRRQKKQLAKAGVDTSGKGISIKDKNHLEIDNPADIKLSVDAERFVRTRLKASHEMSDAEITAAIKRQENVNKYNMLFAPDANKVLKDKVEALQLQKEYGRLNAEMNPSKLKRASDLVKSASDTYNSIPGPLRKMINKQMGDAFKAATEASAARSDRKPGPKAPTLKAPKIKRGRRGRTPGPSSSSSNTVHDITNLGRQGGPHDPQFGDPNLLGLPAPVRHVDELFAKHGVNFSEVSND